MKRTSILLALISILLLSNIVFSSEIANSTPHRHAELFLRYFHTISFKNALNVFSALDQNNQKHILQKVMQKKDQTIFWMLYLLPPEIQFRLCAGCSKDDTEKFETQAVMNSRSIEEHFQWLNQINEKLNTEQLLTIGAGSNIYVKPITLNKAELFELDNKKYEELEHAAKNGWLPKKSFIILANLPPLILEKLRFRYNIYNNKPDSIYQDNRIQYLYKKPVNFSNIAKYGLKSCKEVLPSIITSLIHCCIAKWCEPDLFKRIQDPTLVAENRRKEIANILINQIKTDNMPGSESLRLENIDKIPFNYINKTTIFLNFILGMSMPLTVYISPPIILQFHSPKKTKKTHYYVTRSPSILQSHTKKGQSYLNKYLITFFSLFGTFIPIMNPIN